MRPQIKIYMIYLFTTPISSSVLIILTALFAVTSAITVFDKRLIQAKKHNPEFAHDQMLPHWVKWVWWVHGILLVAIALLNWKYALVVYLIKFVLSVLPVLETIGNMLMSPFKK